MNSKCNRQARPAAGRNLLLALGFLAVPLAGCSTPDPASDAPANTAATRPSANFVSVQPPAQPGMPHQWQESRQPAIQSNRFPQYRTDPGAPIGNPWAHPGAYPSPGPGTPPGYSQPRMNPEYSRNYPPAQSPRYRYRPLSEKEVRDIERQQQWTAENRYPGSAPYNPYPKTQPAPQPQNSWDNAGQWGRYPPARDR